MYSFPFNSEIDTELPLLLNVIVFMPESNFEILGKLKSTLKLRWQKLVRKHYVEFVGEEIPESYLSALYEHGLMISGYSVDVREEFFSLDC